MTQICAGAFTLKIICRKCMQEMRETGPVLVKGDETELYNAFICPVCDLVILCEQPEAQVHEGCGLDILYKKGGD